MASRRTRIKGIANIPQRKKISQENTASSDNILHEEAKPTLNDITEELTSHLTPDLNVNTEVPSGELPTKILDVKTVTEEPKEPINTSSNFYNKLESPAATQTFNHINLEEPGITKENVKDCITKSEISENDVQVSPDRKMESQKLQANILRRKFLKPGININAVKKRQPITTDNLPATENLSSSEAGNKEEILDDNQEKESGLQRLPAVRNVASSEAHFKEEILNKNQVKERGSKPIQNEKNILDGNQEKESGLKLTQNGEIFDENQEKESQEKRSSLKSTEKVVVISEIRIPKYEGHIASKVNKPVSKDTDHFLNQRTDNSEVTLNETHLFVNEVPVINTSAITFSSNIKKIVPETYNVSDSEYPVPPPSPSKINRSRIKAIPRLSQRKTSCSASESEDETRKYGRIRNNSVCSVVSTTCPEPATPTSENAPTKDVMPVLQKKIIRTEQSRKLAEARREFQKRFGDNSPDKQRLKMIDLIFYNPKTNPMGQKSTKASSENDVTEIANENEENIDDPSEVEVVDDKPNSAENGMPVPQIKIGPSGEIVLDEQSLIVENADVARQQEQIRNSKIVNGDFDTGYGIYKRVKRALAWHQKETLRFYKALNVIGTDFTTMTQLFPKRTRRELKMKFKKEEKINKHLIDKAIKHPCRYNFADFKREVELEEAEEAELQKIKEEELKQMELQKQNRREKNKKDKEARAKISSETTGDKTSLPNKKRFKDKKDEDSTLSETNGDKTTNLPNNELYEDKIDQDTTLSETTNDEKSVLPPKKRLKVAQKPVNAKPKTRKVKVKPLNIKSVLDDDSDADISDMDTQSESEEEETIPFLKPTRSGRMPKSTVRFTTINEPYPKQSLQDPYQEQAHPKRSSSSILTSTTPAKPPQQQVGNAIRNRRSSSISSVESNSERLVPGAVVIMTEEDSKGQAEYKVFMVTPDKKMAPLELDSDVIAKLIKERQNEEENAFLVPPIPEKNITIPASVDSATPGEEKQEILVMNYEDGLNSVTE